MSNAMSEAQSGNPVADALKGEGEIRQERANQQACKAYALGLVIGSAAAGIVGGVMASSQVEDAQVQGAETALQCVTHKLSMSDVPRDLIKGPGTGLLAGGRSQEMQAIIAKCRAKLGQSD